jgi:hypothetical protein
MNRENAKMQYAAIITLPYRKSTRHKSMSLMNRAASFAPFAALSGYDDMVREEARLTDTRHDLSEHEVEVLNQQLFRMYTDIRNGIIPTCSVTYFLPDTKKSGGSYHFFTAKVKSVDTVFQNLIFYGSSDVNNKRIPTISIPFHSLLTIQCVSA